MPVSLRTWTAIAVALFNLLVSYALVWIIAPGRAPEVPLVVVGVAVAITILALIMAIRGWRRAVRRRTAR